MLISVDNEIIVRYTLKNKPQSLLSDMKDSGEVHFRIWLILGRAIKIN